MENYISILHPFNGGDLLTILPGLRQLYRDTGKKIKIFQRLNLEAHYYDNQVNSTVNKEGNSVCFNEHLFKMMKPLIEAQEYVESFEVWEGQTVDLDYSVTRDIRSIPLPYGLIHTWGEAVFPQTSTDLSESWVEPVFPKYCYHWPNKIIINKTQRYGNPYLTYYFLKDYQDRLFFSGTEQEHEEFNKKNNLQLELYKIKDFNELAGLIKYCKFGIYSQSLHWHLADAMKTPRVLEVCSAFPNTFSTGKNGYHAFGQAAMEFYFNKLINQ